MTQATKESFIKMLDEDPENEEVLLVYADYLMEQGDPRGEFVAVQIASEKAKEEDDQGKTEELLAVEKELWEENWHRFVEEDFLNHLTEDEKEKLNLTHPKISNFTYRKGRLYGINLPRNQIGDKGAKALAKALAKSKYLSNLKVLWLGNNKIGDEGVKALAESKCLSNLEKLNLGGNEIGDEGAQSLAQSKYLGNLKKLNLGWNEIGEEGAKTLAKSKYLSNLKVLYLGGNNEIGDKGAKALAKSKYLNNLTELYLGNNEIGDEGAKALAESKCLSNLEKLYLGWNEIKDEGAQALAQSEYLSNLKELYLGNLINLISGGSYI